MCGVRVGCYLPKKGDQRRLWAHSHRTWRVDVCEGSMRPALDVDDSTKDAIFDDVEWKRLQIGLEGGSAT